MRDVKVPTTVVREIDTFEEIEIPIKKIVGGTTATATEMYEGPVDESSWMGGQPGGSMDDPYRYGNGPPPNQPQHGYNGHSNGGYGPSGPSYGNNGSYWTDGPPRNDYNRPVQTQVVEEKYQKYRSSTALGPQGGSMGLDTRSQSSTHASDRLSARRASMPASGSGYPHWDDRTANSGILRDQSNYNRELAPPLSARSTRFSPPVPGPSGGEPSTEVLTHTTYQRKYDPGTAETQHEQYTNTSYRSHSPPQNDTTPRTPRNYWN
eukprot:NODE_2323_length_1615_cov_37.552279_g1994_i0.p1 GENE.NODE_2323_length_1615_cov_37.552279_g1994_i0~~NODE_2323_length_1615_cov_37.552279_g1994_i0.p1  ORF type:complete len:264 (+),score=76.52 NODE_2323_length_1615_cov_37.552279_g1994_i0:732-1523(+)